jgi:hypothetical protein
MSEHDPQYISPLYYVNEKRGKLKKSSKSLQYRNTGINPITGYIKKIQVNNTDKNYTTKKRV